MGQASVLVEHWKMLLLVLVSCVAFASAQAQDTDTDTNTNQDNIENVEKAEQVLKDLRKSTGLDLK